MDHTIEELGERADDRDGDFWIRQRSKMDRDYGGKQWEAGMSSNGSQSVGEGHTPDEAVREMLDYQDKEGE